MGLTGTFSSIGPFAHHAQRYNPVMFKGVHLLLFSRNPESDRAFLRDVLEMPAIDAGEGWLIFRLPPAELGVHPGEPGVAHADESLAACVVYLMCRDLKAEIAALAQKGVTCGPVQEAGWGVVTTIPLPSGARLGLYEPGHPLAIEST